MPGMPKRDDLPVAHYWIYDLILWRTPRPDKLLSDHKFALRTCYRKLLKAINLTKKKRLTPKSSQYMILGIGLHGLWAVGCSTNILSCAIKELANARVQMSLGVSC
jgi:hypothetical protein